MEFQLERTLEVLERTPLALRALLQGLSEPWILNDEGPDTFSPRDVVGHLIHGEETDWVPRIRIILEHGESRPFEPFDRFRFRDKHKDKSLTGLLALFGDLRRRNLQFLRSLDLEAHQLDLKGTHPELGAVTVAELIATWSVHDLGHLGQIARVMAKQYEDAVGPWRSYISILDWQPNKK